MDIRKLGSINLMILEHKLDILHDNRNDNGLVWNMLVQTVKYASQLEQRLTIMEKNWEKFVENCRHSGHGD